jgi:hypothetical protein
MTGYNFSRRSFLDRLVVERDSLFYGYRCRKKEDIDHILSTASLMEKYNNNQGRESSREGYSSCHCVCEREGGQDFFLSSRISFTATNKLVNLKLKTKMPGSRLEIISSFLSKHAKGIINFSSSFSLASSQYWFGYLQ